MTPELEIEENLVKHLAEQIKSIEVVASNVDVEKMFDLAKKNLVGLIAVTHSADTATYDNANPSPPFGLLTLPFVITIFINNRRSREDVYEYLHKVRELIPSFKYGRAVPRIASHLISPQRIGDLKEGLFIAELEIEIVIKFPFTQIY